MEYLTLQLSHIRNFFVYGSLRQWCKSFTWTRSRPVVVTYLIPDSRPELVFLYPFHPYWCQELNLDLLLTKPCPYQALLTPNNTIIKERKS